MLIAGGSLSAGFHDPHFGTSMPLGAVHPISNEAGSTTLRKLLISLALLPYGKFAQLRGHWASLETLGGTEVPIALQPQGFVLH